MFALASPIVSWVRILFDAEKKEKRQQQKRGVGPSESPVQDRAGDSGRANRIAGARISNLGAYFPHAFGNAGLVGEDRSLGLDCDVLRYLSLIRRRSVGTRGNSP